MDIYAGLDVSDKMTHICAVDADGRILWRDVCASDPEVLARVRNYGGNYGGNYGDSYRIKLPRLPTVDLPAPADPSPSKTKGNYGDSYRIKLPRLPTADLPAPADPLTIKN